MTNEQKRNFEEEIYTVLDSMKGVDKGTKDDLNIYLDGIKTALEIIGYKYTINDIFVNLEKI